MVPPYSQSVPGDPGRRYKASFELASKVPEHHFCLILFFSLLKLRFSGEGRNSLSLSMGILYEPQRGKSLVAAILEASHHHHHETWE